MIAFSACFSLFSSKENEYRCECLAGFKGELCDINVDECSSSPCQNDGLCVDGVNGYKCRCLHGYQGTHCEVSYASARIFPVDILINMV